MPKTKLGKWTVGLIAVFFFSILSVILFRRSGHRPGELYLIIPTICMMISGIAAFVTAAISLFRFKGTKMVGPMKGKVLIAFFLGLFSFILFMFVGETADYRLGDIAAYIVIVIVMLAYFFICQFLLSRGNPNALFKDWPSMLALGAIGIVILIVTALNERREVFLTQGLGFLFVSFAGILAGAFVASRAARKRGGRQSS